MSVQPSCQLTMSAFAARRTDMKAMTSPPRPCWFAGDIEARGWRECAARRFKYVHGVREWRRMPPCGSPQNVLREENRCTFPAGRRARVSTMHAAIRRSREPSRRRGMNRLPIAAQCGSAVQLLTPLFTPRRRQHMRRLFARVSILQSLISVTPPFTPYHPADADSVTLFHSLCRQHHAMFAAMSRLRVGAPLRAYLQRVRTPQQARERDG